MCRMFALRANQPTRVENSLLAAAHSLQRQSSCDLRGRCHDSGWGIGYYVEGQPRRVRSTVPAGQDPRFRETAGSLTAATVLAHVRLASSGSVAERNTHPFIHGRWTFAHNGTLAGFGANPERLRSLIPVHLLQAIEGATDSEHAFLFLLGQLEKQTGSLSAPASAEVVARTMGETVRQLADLFPAEGEDQSQFNFVLTDGRLMAASRWGHTLYWLRRQGTLPVAADRPVEASAEYHSVAVASEPTTAEAWEEIPDGSVLLLHPDLKSDLMPMK